VLSAFAGNTFQGKNNDSKIIRDILEYEATIAWGNILLDEGTYNKMNASLSNEWKNLKNEYSIQQYACV